MTLLDYLEARGETLTAFARRIGEAPPVVWRIAHGKRRPTARILEVIFEATDGAVAPADFGFKFGRAPGRCAGEVGASRVA